MLPIRAVLDERIYETGKNISVLQNWPHSKSRNNTFHGEWNYKISEQNWRDLRHKPGKWLQGYRAIIYRYFFKSDFVV